MLTLNTLKQQLAWKMRVRCKRLCTMAFGIWTTFWMVYFLNNTLGIIIRWVSHPVGRRLLGCWESDPRAWYRGSCSMETLNLLTSVSQTVQWSRWGIDGWQGFSKHWTNSSSLYNLHPLSDFPPVTKFQNVLQLVSNVPVQCVQHPWHTFLCRSSIFPEPIWGSWNTQYSCLPRKSV